MSGDYETGQIQVTTYNVDGSETHVVLNNHGSTNVNDVTVESIAWRSASFVQEYNDKVGNSSLNSAITLANDMAVNGAQSGGGVDVGGVSTANGAFGTAVGFGEVATLSGQGKYVTSTGAVRDINPAKLTANSKPYATAGKVLKSWGRASTVVGVAVDSYALYNNQISGAKFGLNTGVTAWGLGVGAAGMAIPAFVGGALYFGVDAFYPGGFNGAMQNNSNLIQQNQAILGSGFNLYRDH